MNSFFACFSAINVTITKNGLSVALYVKYFKPNFAKTPQLPQSVTRQRICMHLHPESKSPKSCIFSYVRTAAVRPIGYNINLGSKKIFFFYVYGSAHR